jgi:hypothetical protein
MPGPRTLLRQIPWLRVLAIAQLALIARRHLTLLEPEERLRLARLVRDSKGRPRRNLSGSEREELLRLVRKLEPGAFGRAAFSAVRNPTRFRH